MRGVIAKGCRLTRCRSATRPLSWLINYIYIPFISHLETYHPVSIHTFLNCFGILGAVHMCMDGSKLQSTHRGNKAGISADKFPRRPAVGSILSDYLHFVFEKIGWVTRIWHVPQTHFVFNNWIIEIIIGVLTSFHIDVTCHIPIKI